MYYVVGGIEAEEGRGAEVEGCSRVEEKDVGEERERKAGTGGSDDTSSKSCLPL